MNDFKELEKLMEENRDVLIRLKEGKENKGHIHCPANAWDCPYFDANGCCMMYPNADPKEECDDFYYFWDEDDDYICYDNHEGEEDD